MNTQIYEEASDWLVEFRTEDTDAGARQRFETWLSISPEHVRAYLELTSIWEVVSASEPADASSIDALIARARTVSNVVPLEVPAAGESRSDEPHEARPAGRRRAFTGIVGLAASILLMIVITSVWLYSQRNTYSTAIGEQRSILLSDGSIVELNARSIVRVRFSETERAIDLLAGQALFRVAKDKARPFIVNSNQTKVRAVGTQFDVNQRKHSTIVTVVEGTVSVFSDGSQAHTGPGIAQERSSSQRPPTSQAKEPRGLLEKAPGEILLTAGEQAVLTFGTPPKPQRADIATATAWTQRRLIFDSTPLSEVAEEFNRNNTRPLVIEGKALEDLHVSGAFSSSDPEPLLRFLRAQDGIEIAEQHDRIVVSRSP